VQSWLGGPGARRQNYQSLARKPQAAALLAMRHLRHPSQHYLQRYVQRLN
jgi:hypothetical protein